MWNQGNQRKRKRKHFLNTLSLRGGVWERYKRMVNDPALDRFDSTIVALHDFESIRYPDEIVEKGMQCWVTWTSAQVTTASGPAAAVLARRAIKSHRLINRA